jgi:hypothetical protein
LSRAGRERPLDLGRPLRHEFADCKDVSQFGVLLYGCVNPGCRMEMRELVDAHAKVREYRRTSQGKWSRRWAGPCQGTRRS